MGRRGATRSLRRHHPTSGTVRVPEGSADGQARTLEVPLTDGQARVVAVRPGDPSPRFEEVEWCAEEVEPVVPDQTAKRGRRRRVSTGPHVTRADVRRLARRGGVKRMQGDIVDATRQRLRDYLRDVLRDTVAYTESAGRQTIRVQDVMCALQRRGETLYR